MRLLQEAIESGAIHEDEILVTSTKQPAQTGVGYKGKFYSGLSIQRVLTPLINMAYAQNPQYQNQQQHFAPQQQHFAPQQQHFAPQQQQFAPQQMQPPPPPAQSITPSTAPTSQDIAAFQHQQSQGIDPSSALARKYKPIAGTNPTHDQFGNNVASLFGNLDQKAQLISSKQIGGANLQQSVQQLYG